MSDNSCVEFGIGSTWEFSLSGQALGLADEYTVEISVSDGYLYDDAQSIIDVNEESTQINVDDATVQYSDLVVLSATITDDDDTQLEGKELYFEVVGICSGFGTTNSEGTATFLCGPIPLLEGSYIILVSYAGDVGYYESSNNTATLLVTPENGLVKFHGGNPVAVQVPEPGKNSGPFDLQVSVREDYSQDTSQEPIGEPYTEPGDIHFAHVSVVLEPVGPGAQENPIACVESVFDTFYDARKNVTCSFNEVPLNTYTVVVTVNGGYYAGYAEDVLVVYDPSLGYTTGTGKFTWPITGEDTHFGFTMEYNKKGKNVKGNLLLIRYRSENEFDRVKSNALDGLALGVNEENSDAFGWASFNGKCTYLEAGWVEPIGNQEFTVYVEDRNEFAIESGDYFDRFWIEIRDKDGNVIAVLSMDRDADKNAIKFADGNISVPH
jgi:hypothetical protein